MKRVIAELTDNEHYKLKQYAVDNKISIKKLIVTYVRKLIKQKFKN